MNFRNQKIILVRKSSEIYVKNKIEDIVTFPFKFYKENDIRNI